jgi:hypothetical protein
VGPLCPARQAAARPPAPGTKPRFVAFRGRGRAHATAFQAQAHQAGMAAGHRRLAAGGRGQCDLAAIPYRKARARTNLGSPRPHRPAQFSRARAFPCDGAGRWAALCRDRYRTRLGGSGRRAPARASPLAQSPRAPSAYPCRGPSARRKSRRRPGVASSHAVSEREPDRNHSTDSERIHPRICVTSTLICLRALRVGLSFGAPLTCCSDTLGSHRNFSEHVETDLADLKYVLQQNGRIVAIEELITAIIKGTSAGPLASAELHRAFCSVCGPIC